MRTRRDDLTEVVTFRVTAEVKSKLDRYAARHDTTNGEIIREALERLLDPSSAARRQGEDEVYEE